MSLSILFSLSLLFTQPDLKPASDKPGTILWKITAPELKKPSYLLGVNHVVSSDFLYSFPEIKSAIESSEILMTELFGDNQTAVYGNNSDKNIGPDSALKAVKLLTPEEHNTVDSFFVARVGEGITGNPDALEMNVWEFGSAVLTTLMSDKTRQGVTLPNMDRELYYAFKRKHKRCIGLDSMGNFALSSSDSTKARRLLSSLVERIRTDAYAGSDQPGLAKQADREIAVYKSMSYDYQFSKADPETSALLASNTSAQRNEKWMADIRSGIAENSCLIAVGAGHLLYKTGLISLLRKNGYKVEPVAIKR
ncbi:TraB/GumN family protein [Dyadobacter luteus]|nr:TraB/GumN family protein [Dyadobacter luteus]